MTPPCSDHFNGETFFNPSGPAERGVLDVLRWQFSSRPARWPQWVKIDPALPPPAPADDMAQIKSGKGTLGALVYDEASANNLKASVANIRAVSDKLAKGEGTLGKLINDDTLYNTAQSTLKKADRAIDGLGDSGPITAVGIVANSLF